MINLLIDLIDYPNKKKIINFFKKKFNEKNLIIIDVGAHKGESIKLFYDNFNIEKFSAFEPNRDLYNMLKKNLDKKNLFIYNYGIGEKEEVKDLNIFIDSASSTINELNRNTEYYKRKERFFNLGLQKTFFKEKQKIQVVNLSNFILKSEANVDILKIDTEGFEFKVLKGIHERDLKKIKYIYFEHHYDLMIRKNYKFSDINKLLRSNNFFQKYKIRMKFRKSFEYIYEKKE